MKSCQLTENEIREFAGLLNPKGQTAEEKIEYLKILENDWRRFADRFGNRVEGDASENLLKKTLYESIAETAKLKADELRLRANIRPESEIAQNTVREEAEKNDLTRFERFKNWAKRNLGGISVIAISVAGIITTIVMGMRTVVRKGASATSKFAKALAKIAEKAGPVLGAFLNLRRDF